MQIILSILISESPRRELVTKTKPAPAAINRLVGYARVSTSEQNPQLQIDALRKAGVHDDNLFVETASGASTNRPQLRLVLKQLVPGDTLVVWKLDRLGRSLLHLLTLMVQLDDRSVYFRSLTEGIDTTTAAGRLLLQIIGALAEFERELTRERTAAGMRRAKAEGKQVGAERKVTPEVRKAMLAMFAKGKAVREVADHYDLRTQTIYNNFTRSELLEAWAKSRR